MKISIFRIYFISLFFILNFNVFAQENAVRDELIIMFKNPIQINNWFGVNDRSNSIKSYLKFDKLLSNQLNTYLFKVDDRISLDAAIQELLKLPEIQFAQKNHYIYQRDVIPNDTFFSKQWQWVNNGSITGSTTDADVDAEKAWEISKGGLTSSGDTIVVAVVDDGASLTHADLKENYWKNYNEIPSNGIDDDNNGYVDDYNGWNIVTDNDVVSGGSHGVSVAGMIGAKGNNKTGVTGINWNVKIMQVKYSNSLTESNVVESYSYVLKQRMLYNETNGQKGAFVVACNSSWGIDKGKPSNSPIWCAFYDTMGVHGILSVGATANQNYNIDVDGDLPTSCPSEYLIAVTSSTYADKKAVAGYGKTTIDVAAPGNQIYTTSSNSYTNTSGTSFATPLVSGIVGLLYSVPCPNLSNLYKYSPSEAAKVVRDAIFNGVDVLANFKDLTKYGGRVNAYNSINSLLSSCGSCPKPVGYKTTNLTDTSVTIQWASLNQNQHFDLVYRSTNNTNWDTLKNVTLPLQIKNLRSCTSYEYKVYTICTDTSLGFSDIQTFKTDGCCLSPSNINTVVRNDSTIFFYWDKVLASKNYVLNIKNLETGLVIEKLTNATNIEVSNLSLCTNYEFTIGSYCNDSTLTRSSAKTFKTKGCGACYDLTYCQNPGGSTSIEFIDTVVLNTLKNISGDNNGYAYFPNLTTSLNKIENYQLILSPGFNGSTSNEVFKAWIDYNQDGIFSNDELIISPKQTKVTIAYNFYVPKSAKSGVTRLRILMRFTSSDTSFNACQSFNYGEVEDYCITINPNIICKNIQNVKVEKNLQNNDLLTWDNELTADSILIDYKKASDPNWNVIIVSNTNYYTFSGLDTCTDYNVRVRSFCDGKLTENSNVLNFKTLCTNNIEDIEKYKIDYSISPSPFENDFNITVNNWNDDWKYVIYDMTGKKIEEKLNSSSDKRLNINAINYPSGTYLCKLIFGKYIFTTKIIKS